MKILITGDRGFIGKNLASSFLMQAIYRIELSDFYYDNSSSNITEKNSPDCWTRALKESLETIHPDIIFHVGACSDTLEKDVNYMMEVNYECTKILVDWAKVNNSKLIYSSSAANYGTGLYPSNLYGWSKYVAEGYVVSNGGIALRYFNVYGPGEEHKGKMSSVAYQSYKKIKEGEAVDLFPGNPKRDFIYVKDIVDANKYAVENYESLKGDWYDIGTYEARSFEDVLEGIGILKWGYKGDIDIPNGYQFYTQATKKMGSWIPKFSLKEGLKDYLKYLNVMNNEQQQIINEVFGNYAKMVWRITNIPLYTKEEFIEKCKTDSDFSEKWGLKIEERELSFEERLKISGMEIDNQMSFVDYASILNGYNISTKLITLTYNNETIESYE